MDRNTKLNILFISQLYPLSSYSENSFALHFIIKEWSKDHNVQVIRPYLVYEKELKPKNSQVKIDQTLVDVVFPIWIPVMKVCVINKKKVISLIKNKPDIIFCHLYNSYLTFAFLKSYFEVPFVIGIHNSDIKFGSSILYRFRLNKILKSVDGIAFRSEIIKKNFYRIFTTLNKKTLVVNSGLSSEELSQTEQLINENRKRGSTIKIISACWLIKRKQIDMVIRVLNRINLETSINWTYTIIGEGSEKSKLEKLVKKNNLESKITFKGSVSRVEVLSSMMNHDIFIMPSINETFGLAYIEAMASGCIVIGSEGWGIDGIIQNGINGFLCDSKDIQDIYSKLYQALLLSEVEFSNIKRCSMNTVLNLRSNKIAQDYLRFFLPESAAN